MNVSEKLREKDLKVTPQRIAIYETLASTDKHPSVETIYQSLEKSFPSLSLATVYKTLNTFKDKGLVQELNVGEDSFRYDANCNTHPHFLCYKCEEVYDLPSTKSMCNIVEEIEDKTEFSIDCEQMYFFGTCKDCKGK